MRLARVLYRGHELSGTMNNASQFVPSTDLGSSLVGAGSVCSGNAIEWLPPCVPRQIIGTFNNSRSAIEQYELQIPAHPQFFLKPLSSLCAHKRAISIPETCGRVMFEAGLGVVIKHTCDRITPKVVADHIEGYTCVIELTAIEILASDRSFQQWARAKGARGFTSVGPAIATDLDPETIVVESTLNGLTLPSVGAGNLVFSPWELISRICQDVSLYPGDIIFCGGADRPRFLSHGDEVKVSIAGVGELQNSIVVIR